MSNHHLIKNSTHFSFRIVPNLDISMVPSKKELYIHTKDRHTSVIPSPWEEEARESKVQGQPRQK
jgi:hypothetical protein